MWERIVDAGSGVHILWGLGLLGLLLKMIINTYMKGMVKASENMAVTKKKSLRIIRQKFENGKRLGINNGDKGAYVEKNVRSLKFVALPLEFWRRTGQIICCASCMVMAGGFLFNDVSWRGSPAMVDFLANGVIVCAFLLMLENIFLINNKMEILKANIRDYLENVSPPREVPQRGKSRVSQEDREVVARDESAVTVQGEDSATPEMVNQIKKVVEQNKRDGPSENQIMLDSFLKEFFS